MKPKKNIAQTVRDLATPIAEGLGYEIWDVEYVREGADMILRITIDSDKEGGINIDDCEKMHRAIDPVLDEEDPIEDAYMLAVSSPGVERVLTRPEHFEKCKGEKVGLKLFAAVEGSKSATGELVGVDGDDIVITVGGEEKRYPRKSVAKCETIFEW